MTFIIDTSANGAKARATSRPRLTIVASEPRSFGRPSPDLSADRSDNYRMAARRYRDLSETEREELVANLVAVLARCTTSMQDRMIASLTAIEADYGLRVARGLAQAQA